MRLVILCVLISIVQFNHPCIATESSCLGSYDQLDTFLLQREAVKKVPREEGKLLPGSSQVPQRNEYVEGSQPSYSVIPGTVQIQGALRSSSDFGDQNVNTSSQSGKRLSTHVESLEQLNLAAASKPAEETHSPVLLMLAAVVAAYVLMCGGMRKDEVVLENDFRRGQYTYMLAPMLTSMSSQLLVIQQPYFLMDLGVKGFQLSAVVTASTVGMTVGNIVLGCSSDWFGTRKRVFIVSYFLCSIGAQCLSMSRSYQSVALFSCLNGLFASIIPVQQAFITDRVKPANKPRMFALQQISTSVGMVVGSWLGIVWASNLSYQRVCDLKSGTELVNVMLCSLCVKETTHRENESSDQRRVDKDTASVMAFTYSELANPAILSLVLLAALNGIGWPLIEGMDVMFFKDVCGFGSHEISVLTTVCTAIPLLICPIVPMVLNRLGVLQSITCFSLLGPVLMMPLFIQPNMVTAFVKGIGAYAICNITVQIAVPAVINDRCSEDKKAVVFGLCATAGSLANLVTLPLGGALYDSFSPFITYLVGCASMALAGTGYAFLPSPSQEKHEQRALDRGGHAFKTFAAIGCIACLALLAFTFPFSWKVKRANAISH